MGAGLVSFVTLRALALMPYQGAGDVHGGWPESLAWLLPVLLDVPVVVATAVLVAVDRTMMRTSGETTHQGGAPADALGAASAPSHVSLAANTAPASGTETRDDASAPVAYHALTSTDTPADAPVHQVAQQADARDAEPRTMDIDVVRPDAPEVHQGSDPDPLLMLAHQVVQAGRTTADPETVYMILVRTTAGDVLARGRGRGRWGVLQRGAADHEGCPRGVRGGGRSPLPVPGGVTPATCPRPAKSPRHRCGDVGSVDDRGRRNVPRL